MSYPENMNMMGQSMMGDYLAQNYPAQTASVAAQSMPKTQTTAGPYADAATGQASPAAPSTSTAPITATTQPPAMTLQGTEYLNGALRTMIGRKVTISFLIGTNTYLDRSGTLLGVGANYIILRESTTNNVVFCDFYTIKFVTVYGIE